MTPREESLDPESWEQFREYSHRVLDELLEWQRTLRERPVWQPLPETVRADLRRPLPGQGLGLEGSWDAFRKSVLPYPWGNVHPRFWGWVNGTGSPSGALAELATAVINTNAGGGHQIAPYLEGQVVDWCKAMVGFPASASGVLVTGGSVANLVALAAARDAADPRVTDEGLTAAGARLTMYASAQTHNSVDKAARLLGLGQRGLRSIPVDAEYRMDLAALTRTIAEDRAQGWTPSCIIGNAGTVNTGAIDDLAALADLCERERIWFHVDGAFGALAALSDRLRPLVRGMERAQSVAFDLHKWLYMPYDVGCVLVRDPEAHRRPFCTHASYLSKATRGAAPTDHEPGSLSPELSREFRGLKVWMLLQEHGAAKYTRLIEQNVDQAKYLAGLVHRHAELELLAPVPLNVVCLRYAGKTGEGGKTGKAGEGGKTGKTGEGGKTGKTGEGGKTGKTGEELNALNQELLIRLQERGIAVPSGTVLDGKFAIRVAITNHRSRREDFDLLVDAVAQLGRELSAPA